tara:strand:- start:441 stop:1445 length:1005 start_codon:yes stop_codon:yes gene_type:complete
MNAGSGPSIWWFAFGYFAAYVPYSAMTKALTGGRMVEARPVDGFELLPITVATSLVGMVVFLSAMGWWKHAGHRRIGGVSLPWPGRYTFLSGLCTAAIIGTTTLAYTFEGVSIVFVMLLMRGGVLILAPIVDQLTGRSTRWFSWAALGLSLAALFVAFSERGGFALSVVAGVDIAVYLTGYFIRLQLMSRLAKSGTQDATLRYFVEEQMVASPAMLLALVLIALLAPGAVGDSVRAGFTDLPGPVILPALLIGLCSQLTGIFGGLILLDRRENTFCVPVNRSSSILAGVVASYVLAGWVGAELPSGQELIGAGLVIGAILFLTLPPLAERRRGG